ncbi:MAG: MFS transporter [Bacteroidia bacterium]|nr:MFS transporter [Bacteroidia bacterium]
MVEMIRQNIREKKSARWLTLAIVSFAMLTAYLFMEIISPLKTMVQNAYGWDSFSWGVVTGAQEYLNVFAFMLIISGIVLDKLGIRFTAISAGIVMVSGACIKYYAFIGNFDATSEIFGIRTQVFIAAAGYAVFCVGAEAAGITVSKVIVKWFKGREMALAMGLEMASARLGSFAALAFSPMIADKISISTPILLSLLGLLIGLILFIVYSLMDVKLDRQLKLEASTEEQFRVSDIKYILSNRGFWYIAILCVLFYSAVFRFYKYGPDMFVNKFGIDDEKARWIPSLLPFGTLFLTPLFGSIYDKRGKGATIMILGAFLLILVHIILWIPSLTSVAVAIIAVVVLGIAFSLVPSAMWPSVPKIIPEQRLGSAYALIFYIQNIGLSGIPLLLGYVLDKTNPGIAAKIDNMRETLIAQGFETHQIQEQIQIMRENGDIPQFDYSSTWLIFISCTIFALVFAFLLKAEDKRKSYGLELPNIQK